MRAAPVLAGLLLAMALVPSAAEALSVPCSANVLSQTELLLVQCAVGPGVCVVVVGQNHGFLFVGTTC